MASYQSYIICTSPRSGSTLLCGLLAATGIAGNPESYFHSPSVSDWLKALDLDPPLAVGTCEALGLLFDAVRARGTGGSGVFGLRLQRKSFDFLNRQLGNLHPRLASDAERFRAAFGRTLFIHLSRGDKLDQAISYVRATQTGLWHIAPDGTELERLSAPQEPIYDGDEIARQMAVLGDLDRDWTDWFARERIAPLRLTYAEVAATPADALGTILGRLGLDESAAKDIAPTVAKLADVTSRHWKERFLAENIGV